MEKRLFKGTESSTEYSLNLVPAEAFAEYKQGLLIAIKQQITNLSLTADFQSFMEKNVAQNNEKVYTSKGKDDPYLLYYSQELFKNRVFEEAPEKSTAFYLIKLDEVCLVNNIEAKYGGKLGLNYREGLLSDNQYRQAETHMNNFIFDKFGVTLSEIETPTDLNKLYSGFNFNKKELNDIKKTVKLKTAEIATDLGLSEIQLFELEKKVTKVYLLFVFLTDMYQKGAFDYTAVSSKESKDKEYSAYMLWHDVIMKNKKNVKAYCNDITNLAVRMLQHSLFSDSISSLTAGFVIESRNVGIINNNHTALIVGFNTGNGEKKIVIDIDDAKKKLKTSSTSSVKACFNDQDTAKIKHSDNLSSQARFIVNYGFNNNLGSEISSQVLNIEKGNMHLLNNLYAVNMRKWENFQKDPSAINGLEEFLLLLNNNMDIGDEWDTNRLIINVFLLLLLHVYHLVHAESEFCESYRGNTVRLIRELVDKINENLKTNHFQVPFRQDVIGDIRSLLNMLTKEHNRFYFSDLMQLIGEEADY